jgi:hypothetical protein
VARRKAEIEMQMRENRMQEGDAVEEFMDNDLEYELQKRRMIYTNDDE